MILVSFDALAADLVARFGAPSFTSLPVRVARITPVEPSATSATHAAILTGEQPEKTGIVSNQFHAPGTPPEKVTYGLQTEIAVPTIVDRTREAGKRVGSILFPFVDARSARRTADFGLAWNSPVSASRIIHLNRDSFHREWLPQAWGTPQPKHASFSPVLRARLEWSIPQRTREDIDLAAYDTSDDHTVNYDSFYVETPAGEMALDAHGWFSIAARLDDGVWGSWSKVLHANADLRDVTIYWGAIHHNDAYPATFRELIDGELGAWPGEPDQRLAQVALEGRDGIDPATFAEQVQRLSAFETRATEVAMTRMPCDLLLAYFPILDETEHQFLIVDQAQRNGTPENIAAAERVLRSAYAAFDSAVASLRSAADPAYDALIVTGDHGIAPADTEVHLEALLPSNWKAFSNGNVTHVYRFGGNDDTDAVVQQLALLHAPDGAAVFERVRRRTERDHPNSGDIVAFAFPRFALVNGSGEAFRKSVSHGQHGGLTTHPEYDTTLGAVGAGLAPQAIDRMRQVDIEPVVEKLLGIAR